jgi:microcin C transport system permease protein
VVARLIYTTGFPLGAVRAPPDHHLVDVGVAAGGVQGYSAAGSIWPSSASSRSGRRFLAVSLLILSPGAGAASFCPLGILLLFSLGLSRSVWCAPIPARTQFEYIMAARALGYPRRDHVPASLPNAMVATMTFLPFIVSSSVMTLTALDFLGFGLPPGSPSLGELLSQGKANVQAPWLGFTGFFAVAIMLSLLIFIGEAVRDAFDPRKTFR